MDICLFASRQRELLVSFCLCRRVAILERTFAYCLQTDASRLWVQTGDICTASWRCWYLSPTNCGKFFM